MLLYDVVDSLQYIADNCYQHQLSSILDNEFEIRRITFDRLISQPPPSGAVVLSRLRLRTLHGQLQKISAALEDRQLIVYEQDPWESFMMGSSLRGAYETIAGKLNVVSFLNTSLWWSERVRELGLPSRFVQMWMLPQYCPEPVPWTLRKHDVVFCGTLKPHRVTFFERLKKEGVNVSFLPSRSYKDYLELLSRSRITIRSESIDWNVEFASGPVRLKRPHGLWIRDIECASRGCFSLREPDDEGRTWGIKEIPTIITFDDVESAADEIHRLASLSNDVADDLVKKSVDRVRQAEGWRSVPRAIRSVLVNTN